MRDSVYISSVSPHEIIPCGLTKIKHITSVFIHRHCTYLLHFSDGSSVIVIFSLTDNFQLPRAPINNNFSLWVYPGQLGHYYYYSMSLL